MLEHFRQLFRYDDWANREVLAGFPSSPPPRSLKLVAHILGTEYVWFSRLNGQASPLVVWPELSVPQCQEHAARLPQIWSNYLDGLQEAQLPASVTYKNSKGESWTNLVEDILMHVVMHSAYHRGQIASDMRSAGHTPAYTDFIHGVRQRLIE